MRGITIATIVVLAPALAAADDKQDPHFEKASELKAKGDVAGACAEFKLALAANPAAVGLVLNFAQCSEELGRFHTAKLQFLQLKQLAAELGLPEYGRTADEHLAKLKDMSGKLALTFEEPPDTATKVTIGDDVYDVSKETTLEVNPGKLHFVVSHPGRITREESIEIQQGEVKAFHVKKLVALKRVNNTYRNVGIAATAVGGVGIIAGGIMGLVAKSNYNKEFPNNGQEQPVVTGQPPPDVCINKTTTGQPIPAACGAASGQRVTNAINLAKSATYIMTAGAVLAVGGAVLWFAVGPREVKEKPVAIIPVIGPNEAGVFAVGRF
jgi:hypothetical protein